MPRSAVQERGVHESDEPAAPPDRTVYEPDEPSEELTPGRGEWTDEDERAAVREEE